MLFELVVYAAFCKDISDLGAESWHRREEAQRRLERNAYLVWPFLTWKSGDLERDKRARAILAKTQTKPALLPFLVPGVQIEWHGSSGIKTTFGRWVAAQDKDKYAPMWISLGPPYQRRTFNSETARAHLAHFYLESARQNRAYEHWYALADAEAATDLFYTHLSSVCPSRLMPFVKRLLNNEARRNLCPLETSSAPPW